MLHTLVGGFPCPGHCHVFHICNPGYQAALGLSICPLQQTLKIVERPLNIGPTLDLSVPQDR